MEERKRKRSKRLKSHGGVEQRSALEDEMASPPLYRNGEENQSSPSLSLSLAYMRLHYLRSASLQALANLPPRPPPCTNVFAISSNRATLRVVVRCVPATLRNFISYASLIIRRSFTRFPSYASSIPLPITLSGKTGGRIRSLLSLPEF